MPKHLKTEWMVALGMSLVVAGCTMPVSLPPAVVTSLPIQVTLPTPPPTPPSRFEGLPPGAVITLVTVGSIPANTPVRIGSLTFDPATGWVYTISTLDDRQSATAADADLAVAPGFNFAQPTPAPLYQSPGYWGECYPLVTTEALPIQGAPAGSSPVLPAGTRVRVGSMLGEAYYLGNGRWAWFYNVVPEGELYAARAREEQLAPAPGVDPQEMAGPTPAAPYPFGMGNGYNFITREAVGEIAAGTRVSLGSAHYGCGEWIYAIVTADGHSADARASQIEPVPGFDPNAPTAALPPAPPTP